MSKVSEEKKNKLSMKDASLLVGILFMIGLVGWIEGGGAEEFVSHLSSQDLMIMFLLSLLGICFWIIYKIIKKGQN